MWTEENRLSLISGEEKISCYFYDGSGERTLKLIADHQQMQINDSTNIDGYISNNQTLYVNPYLVINNREYTKHYYIENQRIISKIGGGFISDSVPLFSLVYGFNRNSAGAYHNKKLDLEKMIGRDLDSCELSPNFIVASGLYALLSDVDTLNTDESENVYYYHPDHLGSTSYITNSKGMTSQHVDYTPFGEVLLEEMTGGWYSPYKFNAKELDMESGLYYYGARYYDPRTSVWLGVDPLSDKYPEISPFVYCANNPVILVDPNGRAIYIWYTVKDNNGKETKTSFKFTGNNASSAPKNSFVQKAISAYNYDTKNGGGDNLKKAATNGKYRISLSETKKDNKTIYTPDGNNYIYWNPDKGNESENGLKTSPATNLEHEMDHAVDAADNYDAHAARADQEDAAYDNKEEKRVITGSEKKTATANGEFKKGQVRKSHKGSLFPVSSPKSNKPLTD